MVNGYRVTHPRLNGDYLASNNGRIVRRFFTIDNNPENVLGSAEFVTDLILVNSTDWKILGRHK